MDQGAMASVAGVGLLVLVAFWIATAVLSGIVATAKGANGGAWFAAGLLFGPLGLLAAAGLPDLHLRAALRAHHSGAQPTGQPSRSGPLNSEAAVSVPAEPAGEVAAEYKGRRIYLRGKSFHVEHDLQPYMTVEIAKAAIDRGDV